MTKDEFDQWVVKYRTQFLSDNDPDWEFILGWEPKLIGETFADACRAIVEVAGDARNRFPRFHLPLLIEWIDIFKEDRRRAASAAFWRAKAQEPPAPPSLDFARTLLSRGYMTQKEFDQREKAFNERMAGNDSERQR